MPDTEMVNTLVIGAVSGHIRTTKTWILGRLLRDGDDLVDKEMDDREEAHIPPSATPSSIASSQDQLKGKAKDRPWEALRVSVFEVIPGAPHGIPTRDWVWWSGYVIIIVQLAISIIPWIKSQEWGTFMIAGVGNFLALLEGSLPQWRREKWACPKTGGATVTITQGNGSRHAMVILQSRGKGLDIEILAQGTRTKKASTFTRISTAVLALLWIALLGTVSGLKIDTWCKSTFPSPISLTILTYTVDLLGIGLLGSIQNVVAAGAPRSPSAMGFHIRLVETITGSSVARVLRETESKYQFVGTSLVQVFFPGSLRVKEEDIDFWREAQDQRLRPNKWGARIDNLPEKEKVDGYEDLSEIQPGNGVWKRGMKFETQEVRDSYL